MVDSVKQAWGHSHFHARTGIHPHPGMDHWRCNDHGESLHRASPLVRPHITPNDRGVSPHRSKLGPSISDVHRCALAGGGNGCQHLKEPSDPSCGYVPGLGKHTSRPPHPGGVNLLLLVGSVHSLRSVHFLTFASLLTGLFESGCNMGCMSPLGQIVHEI